MDSGCSCGQWLLRKQFMDSELRRSGKLSYVEFSKAMSGMNYKTNFKQLWKDMDDDNSGTVSLVWLAPSSIVTNFWQPCQWPQSIEHSEDIDDTLHDLPCRSQKRLVNPCLQNVKVLFRQKISNACAGYVF